jgi:hypothetical protein
MADAAELPHVHMPDLLARIDGARQRYVDARDAVTAALAPLFSHPIDAADALLDVAEEFGSDHAVDVLQSDRATLGDVVEAFGAALHPDAAETVRNATETVLEARDGLDNLVAERERRLRAADPSRAQRISFAGRDYAVDPQTSQLRADHDAGEVHSLVAEPRGGRPLTLSEETRLREGVDRAEPRAPEPRDRVR